MDYIMVASDKLVNLVRLPSEDFVGEPSFQIYIILCFFILFK